MNNIITEGNLKLSYSFENRPALSLQVNCNRNKPECNYSCKQTGVELMTVSNMERLELF